MSLPEGQPKGPLAVARHSGSAIMLVLGAALTFLFVVGGVIALDPISTAGLLAAILAAGGVAHRLLFGSFAAMDRIEARRAVVAGAVGLAFVMVVIQAVPYGRDHTNPPVVSEPRWNSPATRSLAAAACFMCHSNETQWPGYSNLAPVSWALTEHVTRARGVFDFSDWGHHPISADEIAGVVTGNHMPPWNFLLLHPEARLTGTQRAKLVAGIRATLSG